MPIGATSKALTAATMDSEPRSAYVFRPLVAADLPLISRWLRAAEVARWWGDPETEQALIAQDLAEPLMRQWIVEHQGHPFAYAQVYPAHAWPQPHLAHLPGGAAAIDAFIGEPAMLGHGHGRRFLRQLAAMVLAEGAGAVAIDPAIDNHRARRAFAQAGFAEEGIVETAAGPAVLMLYRGAANPGERRTLVEDGGERGIRTLDTL